MVRPIRSASSPATAIACPSAANLGEGGEVVDLVLVEDAQQHLLGDEGREYAVPAPDRARVHPEPVRRRSGTQIEQEPVARIDVAAEPDDMVDARSAGTDAFGVDLTESRSEVGEIRNRA